VKVAGPMLVAMSSLPSDGHDHAVSADQPHRDIAVVVERGGRDIPCADDPVSHPAWPVPRSAQFLHADVAHPVAATVRAQHPLGYAWVAPAMRGHGGRSAAAWTQAGTRGHSSQPLVCHEILPEPFRFGFLGPFLFIPVPLVLLRRGFCAQRDLVVADCMRYPVTPFRHLQRLTDNIGLLRHADGVVPLREHGYYVDDVARGLLVVCREPSPSQELIVLGRRYLYFLAQAQALGLSHASAAIAEAVIVSGRHLGDDRMLRNGLRMLKWLLTAGTRDGRLSAVSPQGWGRGESRPASDQRPAEVAALADACMRAAAVTGDDKWLTGVEMSVAWFLGDNDAKEPLLDERTGGCSDSLTSTGRSRNAGRRVDARNDLRTAAGPPYGRRAAMSSRRSG
jgi:hypothetical protein